jgi:rubrerythrin
MALGSDQKFGSVQEILDYAIREEQESRDFYMYWSRKVEKSWIKKMFMELADEELQHKEKLTAIKENKLQMRAWNPVQQVPDLKISDYLVDVNPDAELDYQEALILAMKKEKKAFKLYTDFAENVQEDLMRALFLGLAQEEAKHKLKLETEYDEYILTEN